MQKPRRLNAKQFRALLMFSTHMPFGPPEITPVSVRRWDGREYTNKITFGTLDVSSQFKSLERRNFVRLETRMQFVDGDSMYSSMRHLVVKRQVIVTKAGRAYLDDNMQYHCDQMSQPNDRKEAT